MTTQTKRFIELDDILALRVECRCSATVSTPISSFQNVSTKCPNCGTPFTGYESQRALLESFSAIVDAFKTVKRIADYHKFSFSLEIVEPKPSIPRTSEQAQ